jgi:hypothetical protein
MINNVAQVAEPKVFGIGHGSFLAHQWQKIITNTPIVLRYSPYNRAVKDVINSGALGEIINIQHIEPVGNQHFTHSYVRGNWHKESESSFALMTKCCQ